MCALADRAGPRRQGLTLVATLLLTQHRLAISGGRPPPHRPLRLHRRPLPLVLPHVPHTSAGVNSRFRVGAIPPALSGSGDRASGLTRIHGTQRENRRDRARPVEMPVSRSWNYAVTSPVSRLEPEVGDPLERRVAARAQWLLPDRRANVQFALSVHSAGARGRATSPATLSTSHISLSCRRSESLPISTHITGS